jgi:Domain of unknown function (DUF4112)
MEWVALILLSLALVCGLGVAAYFILRRLFDRAADRVADRIGSVLGDLGAKAAGTRAGRSAARRMRAITGGYTHFGAYAAAHGMSEDQARREFADSIERIARIMDGAVRLPIIGPVGLDAVLGLFPVAGDLLSSAIAVSLIGRSLKYGVPHDLIARMLGNVLFDFILGAVPVAGDVADMWFRANMRNVALLREYLEREARDTFDTSATRVS